MIRLRRWLVGDRWYRNSLAECCALGAMSMLIAGCEPTPDAPAVELAHVAQTGGRPGPIALADGRILIASGTRVTVYPSIDVGPAEDRSPTLVVPSIGVDLEVGEAIELVAEGNFAAARIESGRIAIIDIAERVPEILDWLDEPGESMAWLEGVLITLGDGGYKIRTVDARSGRLDVRSLTNPCEERARFLDAAGGRAIILCDDGEIWSMAGDRRGSCASTAIRASPRSELPEHCEGRSRSSATRPRWPSGEPHTSVFSTPQIRDGSSSWAIYLSRRR